MSVVMSILLPAMLLHRWYLSREADAAPGAYITLRRAKHSLTVGGGQLKWSCTSLAKEKLVTQ